MNAFGKKLEEASDQDLKQWINNGDFEGLASDELTRRKLKELQDSIEKNTKQLNSFSNQSNKYNEDSSAQTNRMLSLTMFNIFLTAASVLGLFIGLYFAKIQITPILNEQEWGQRRAYEICKEDITREYTGTNGARIKCADAFENLKEKFE